MYYLEELSKDTIDIRIPIEQSVGLFKRLISLLTRNIPKPDVVVYTLGIRPDHSLYNALKSNDPKAVLDAVRELFSAQLNGIDGKSVLQQLNKMPEQKANELAENLIKQFNDQRGSIANRKDLRSFIISVACILGGGMIAYKVALVQGINVEFTPVGLISAIKNGIVYNLRQSQFGLTKPVLLFLMAAILIAAGISFMFKYVAKQLNAFWNWIKEQFAKIKEKVFR